MYNYDVCYTTTTIMTMGGWHTAVGIVESFPAQIGPSVWTSGWRKTVKAKRGRAQGTRVKYSLMCAINAIEGESRVDDAAGRQRGERARG